MKKPTSCKKTPQSPDCSSSMMRSRQFKRFWNWFGRSKCPRAVLDLLVNFHHELSFFPTRWPWASEDVIVPDSRTVNICLSRWFWVRVISSYTNVAWIHVAYLLLETFIKVSQKLNCKSKFKLVKYISKFISFAFSQLHWIAHRLH